MDLKNIWHFLLDPIDLYCERTDGSFWSEPLNLLSNAGFLLLAWRLYVLAGRVEKELARQALVYLAVIATLVGIGSALFHSMPNHLTQFADVLPISIFVALSVFFYFRERSERSLPIRRSLTLCLLFVLLAPIAGIIFGLAPYLSKGEYYLGLMPALACLAFFEENKRKQSRIIAATTLFIGAFSARSLDAILCPNFPLGSHFLWHLGSASAAYFMASVQALSEPKTNLHAKLS